MNLSAENIGKIRELVRSGYPLKARDAQDLEGHNEHLTQLLEARFRLMLGLEIERDQLRAENAGLKTGYEAYEQVVQGLKAENEVLRKDAGRWTAFVNCARIKFFGWAGYDEKDPYGNSPGDYRHFGGEFWTVHDAPTADKEKAAKILNGFADASVAAMSKEPSHG